MEFFNKNKKLVLLLLLLFLTGATTITTIIIGNGDSSSTDEDKVEDPGKDDDNDDSDNDDNDNDDNDNDGSDNDDNDNDNDNDNDAVVEDLKGSLSATTSATEIIVTVTLSNESVIGSEVVNVVISKGLTEVNSVAYALGTDTYTFDNLEEFTEYEIGLETDSSVLDNKVSDITATTKETIKSANGTFTASDVKDTSIEVELDLQITVTEQTMENYEVVITGVDSPSYTETITYDAVTKKTLFTGLTAEERYKISLVAPTGYINNVVPLEVTTLKETFKLEGTILATPVSLDGTKITIDTSSIVDSHISTQIVTIVATDDSGVDVASVTYVIGTTNYELTGLTENTLYTISVKIDDTEFLISEVPSVDVTTSITHHTLEGSISGTSGGTDTINVTVSLTDDSVIRTELVEVTLTEGATVHRMTYVQGQTDYVFTGLMEATDYTINFVVDNETYLTNAVTGQDTVVSTDSSVIAINGTINVIGNWGTQQVNLEYNFDAAQWSTYVINDLDDFYFGIFRADGSQINPDTGASPQVGAADQMWYVFTADTFVVGDTYQVRLMTKTSYTGPALYHVGNSFVY